MSDDLFAIGLGLVAGVVSGLLGVGGGTLFVPTLLALGLSQRSAEATSLLAILPTVAAVGSSRVDLQACKLEYSIVSPK